MFSLGRFFWIAHHKVLHPVSVGGSTLGLSNLGFCRLRGNRFFSLAGTQRQLMIFEAANQSSVQLLLNANARFAQPRPRLFERNLIMLSQPTDGLVVGHRAFFHIAQNGGQVLVLKQRLVSTLGTGRRAPETAIPFRQIAAVEELVGGFEGFDSGPA